MTHVGRWNRIRETVEDKIADRDRYHPNHRTTKTRRLTSQVSESEDSESRHGTGSSEQ